MEPHGDGARRVAAHAETCAAELAASGQPPQTEAAVRRAGGWTVLTLAVRTPSPADLDPEPPPLSECDLNCLALLGVSPEPLSAARIRRRLERCGTGIHALITVKRSLAKLKRLGLVLNSRVRPRGYFLPEVSEPLLQYRPAEPGH